MSHSVKGLLLASLAGSALGNAISRAAPLPVADTVFVNGLIHTLDAKSTTVTGGIFSNYQWYNHVCWSRTGLQTCYWECYQGGGLEWQSDDTWSD